MVSFLLIFDLVLLYLPFLQVEYLEDQGVNDLIFEEVLFVQHYHH